MSQVSGFNTAATLAGPDPLTIGAVMFRSEECPEQLEIGGGEQMMTTHNLIGGGVVINKLGVKPRNVSWRGKLWDANVETRVIQLRSYMVEGTEVLVTWRQERYYAIVKNFVPDYHHAWLAEYSIDLAIVRDANGAFETAKNGSLDDQVGALSKDLSNQTLAINQLDPNASKVLGPDLAAMNVKIQSAGSLSTLTGANLQAVLNSVQKALQTVQKYRQQIISAIDARLAPIMRMISTIKLIAANIRRGLSLATLRVAGGDLYSIAAQVYGDVSLASQLMSANGLHSPWLPQGKLSTIILPPFPKKKVP